MNIEDIKGKELNVKFVSEDDIRDIAIRIVDELVRQDIIASDVDTDNETEFQIQDVIFNELKKQNLNFEDEEVEDIWRPFL
tara:strand:- start:966 stop:1208 length:243 start_codon:yes stop_codon:yes gene_type:complete